MLRALLIVLATLLASSAMADDLSLGDPGWTQTGKASYYSSRLHGRRTASGARAPLTRGAGCGPVGLDARPV